MSFTPDPRESERLIQSSAHIHMHAFQVAVGILTGLALLCFFARMAIRIKYQKQLRLDDAFLILAAGSLSAAIGILYSVCYFLYLHSAALRVPQLLPYILDHFDENLQLPKRIYLLTALIWTTIFAVKGCFLAFMRPLVWHISRAVNWYYWFIVVFCIVSWAFLIVYPFIICPYFGTDATKCFSGSAVGSGKSLGLTALVTVIDILSDIMVVSIPIIVLKSSLLSWSTKIRLGPFLSLSIVMAVCSIIRIAGFHYKRVEDDIWEVFWQYTESAVAVMMASITAFRTLFVKQANVEPTEFPGPAEGPFRRLFKGFQALARAQPEEKPTLELNTSALKLPKLPSPVFTGVRSFIRRNNRTDVSAGTWNSLDSIFDGSQVDYHATLKSHTRAAGNNASSSHQSPNTFLS